MTGTDFTRDYLDFLKYCRTERDVIQYAARLLNANKDIKYETRSGRGLVAVRRTGRNDPVRIIGAHVDSPRIDLKMNPLYCKDGLAYLDTHYYGGLKKYQWCTIPLGLAGVVYRPGDEGYVTRHVIRMGLPEWPGVPSSAKTSDRVFCINDLLPHLSRKRMDKPAREILEGEDMDVVAAIRPPWIDKKTDANLPDDKCGALAEAVTKLNMMLGISPGAGDFASSELSLVPAIDPAPVGLDGQMVGGYGQDDRSCAFAAIHAFIDSVKLKDGRNNTVLVLTDKEEIGSEGVTGAQCDWYYNTMLRLTGFDGQGVTIGGFDVPAGFPVDIRMISADVTAAYDPMFEDEQCERTAAKIGDGIAISKYTGSGGKYDASDASPEYVAAIRGLLDEAKVSYQFDEMGKVDAGGGGTIAMYFARRGIDVIDAGIPLLNMHSPFEIAAFRDIYSAYEAYTAFYANKMQEFGR